MEFVAAADLQPFNTLALPGRAEYLCEVTSRAELDGALAFARQRQLPVSVLGGGSNTVLGGPVSGLVVRIANRGIAVVAEDERSVTVEVAAGENWHQLVMASLQRGWYGLENLALIPGLAGAAPIQNIGAYGVELSEFLDAVSLVEIDSGRQRTLTAGQCELGYRDSIFKRTLRGRVVIMSLRLRLSKQPQPRLDYPELAAAVASRLAERRGRSGDNPTPAEVADTVIALRNSKLPNPEAVANAGSFFKNPVLPATQARALMAAHPGIPHYPQADGTVKFPAAWLIDRAGWKGQRRGNVAVHHRQALVLVHLGQGSGEELLAFADRIAADVLDKYGVALEMEPVVLGGPVPADNVA